MSSWINVSYYINIYININQLLPLQFICILIIIYQ